MTIATCPVRSITCAFLPTGTVARQRRFDPARMTLGGEQIFGQRATLPPDAPSSRCRPRRRTPATRGLGDRRTAARGRRRRARGPGVDRRRDGVRRPRRTSVRAGRHRRGAGVAGGRRQPRRRHRRVASCAGPPSAGATSRSRATGRWRRTTPLVPPAVRRLIDHRVAASLADPEASLARARRGEAPDDPPAGFGSVRPRRLLATAEPRPRRPRPTRRPHLRTAAQAADLPELDEAADDGGASDVGALVTSPVGGRGLLGRLLRHLLRPARGTGGGGPAGAPTPRRTAATPRPHGRGAVSSTPAGWDPTDAGAAFAPRTHTYPEWDVHRRALPRRTGARVRERDPAPTDLAPMALPDGRALRRPLARLGHRSRPHAAGSRRATTSTSTPRSRRGSTRWPASPHDDDVYVDSLRRRRDLSVLVLLDVSGSAGEPGPAGRTVHEHQRSAAAALTAALHDLGDRVALYAFNSHGRTAVQLAARQALRRPPRRPRGPAPRRPRPGARTPASGRRSATARTLLEDAWRHAAAAAASCCPTASPTTTATRAATARPTPGARSSRPAGAASAACASASAPATDARGAAAGVRHRGPRHHPHDRAAARPRSGRCSGPRCGRPRPSDARSSAQARTRERLALERRTA